MFGHSKLKKASYIKGKNKKITKTANSVYLAHRSAIHTVCSKKEHKKIVVTVWSAISGLPPPHNRRSTKE